MTSRRFNFLTGVAVVLTPPILVLMIGAVLLPEGDEPSDVGVLYMALIAVGAGIAFILALVGVVIWTIATRRARSKN